VPVVHATAVAADGPVVVVGELVVVVADAPVVAVDVTVAVLLVVVVVDGPAAVALLVAAGGSVVGAAVVPGHFERVVQYYFWPLQTSVVAQVVRGSPLREWPVIR